VSDAHQKTSICDTWPEFFLSVFDTRANALAEVLSARGCREGWLQAEFFRAVRVRGVQVNAYPLGKGETADLFSDFAPRMVAEIKIIGADHQSKMRDHLDKDVRRLRAIQDSSIERYMLLVIPASDVTTALGAYLATVRYGERCCERDYARFRVRLWTIER
jgi:hypothetical protein